MRKVVQRSIMKASDSFYGLVEPVLSFGDPEDLHRMRVAGRTLLSLLFVLADEEEAKSRGFLRVRRPLKRAMDLLGALRDTDVLLGEVDKRLAGFSPEERGLAEKWLEHKREERESLRAELAKKLPATIDKRWKKRIDGWTEDRAFELAKKSSMVRKVRALRNDKALALIAISHYPEPDMANEEFLNLIHRSRISIKKLRYALEVLKKFANVDENEIEGLKGLQDRLGHIQDLRAWIRELEGFYDTGSGIESISTAWREEMLATLRETNIWSDAG